MGTREQAISITWYGDSGGYKNVPFDSVNLHKHNIIMNIITSPNNTVIDQSSILQFYSWRFDNCSNKTQEKRKLETLCKYRLKTVS